MLDRLVDLLDGLVEMRMGQIIVPAEIIFKPQKAVLEIGNIDVLVSDHHQFLLILQGIQRRIPEKGNNRDEALSAFRKMIERKKQWVAKTEKQFEQIAVYRKELAGV